MQRAVTQKRRELEGCRHHLRFGKSSLSVRKNTNKEIDQNSSARHEMPEEDLIRVPPLQKLLEGSKKSGILALRVGTCTSQDNNCVKVLLLGLLLLAVGPFPLSKGRADVPRN